MDPYQTTFQTWNKVAALYQEKFMDLDRYNDTYDRLCGLIGPPNARILEIGCGPGNITRYLLSKHPDFKVEAIDVAPNMIELAKANNPTASFHVMDCRAIDTLPGPYDVIICGFCMPYLSKEDVIKLFKDTYRLLGNNGLFYFSTIEGDYSHSGFIAASTGDESFVYFYDEAFLRQQLAVCGFEVPELSRKHYPKGDGMTTEIICITRKPIKQDKDARL